ncbi:DUF6506 family protein [Sphaerisporangium sp. TRM90804]|uniref:DUF6506 family protein n=1 Tax=Sphaerisporangium sp. TRM90804 TaxID=3031113 RepID=UPI0024468565|nr:DUF6506 family protein [Sphaerisporangium sp. TRM90804]MDH2427676.1 DUF6506 family protein [Sphaerisporangium sp. TRM90804]
MGSHRAIITLDQMEPVVHVEGADRMTILGVADGDAAARAALSLVADGVRSIELCGAFGPLAGAPVLEAIDGEVPVGLVLFGMESLTSVAAYKARAEAGEPMTAAFLFITAGADPAIGHTVREHEGGRALFVAVPDESAAPKAVADLLAQEDVQLIELYGGFTPAGAARVVEAVDARIPVGLATYALTPDG